MTPRQLCAGKFSSYDLWSKTIVLVLTIVLALQGSRTILALIATIGAMDVRKTGVPASLVETAIHDPRFITADT